MFIFLDYDHSIFLYQAFHRLLVRLTCNRRYSMEGRGGRHHHCYSRISPALSDPSLIPEYDSEDSEDSEDDRQQGHCGPSAPPIEEVAHLRKIMEKFNHEMERNRSEWYRLLSNPWSDHTVSDQIYNIIFWCNLCSLWILLIISIVSKFNGIKIFLLIKDSL